MKTIRHLEATYRAPEMSPHRLALAFALLLLIPAAMLVAPLGAQSAAPVGPASPLAAYPGFGHDFEADEARYELEAQAREGLIATCMADAGFVYHPEPPTVVVGETLPPPTLQRMRVSPNEQVTAQLDAGERLAYNRTLYGVDDPNDPRAEAQHDPSSPVGGGCLAAAHRAIPGVFAAKSALTEEYLEMERQVRGDHRVELAEMRWSQCMNGLGYTYDSPQSLNAALDESLMRAEVTGESVATIVREQEQAVEMAKVCGERMRFAETVRAVRLEAEAAFVEQHKALLEEHLERLKTELPR